MLKSLFKFLFLIFLALAALIFYLSVYGIETNKFNNIVNEKFQKINPNLNLLLSDVYLKLNIRKLLINIEVNKSEVIIDNSKLNLSKIKASVNIFKLIKKQNSIDQLEINLEENKIKDLASFLNEYDFNLARFILFNQIDDGIAKITIKINLNDNDRSKIDYKLNGYVKNGKINFLNKHKISNINFKFKFGNKKTQLNDLKFNYSNLNFLSNNIIIEKSKNLYVKGDLENIKGNILPKAITKYLDKNFNFFDEKYTNIYSKNNFSFTIKDNKLQNLKLNSKINYDKLILNPEYTELFYLENGVIESNYNNNILNLSLNSQFKFFNDDYNSELKNNLKVRINRKNKKTKLLIEFDNNENIIETKELTKFFDQLKDLNLSKKLKISSNNKIDLEIDKNNNFKINKIDTSLKVDKFKVFLDNPNLKKFFPEFKNNISFYNNNFKIKLVNKKISISSNHEYFFENKKNKDKINLNLVKTKDNINIIANWILDNQNINISELNFTKAKKEFANIKTNFNINNKKFLINDFNFNNKNGYIKINNLKFDKNYKIQNIEFAELNLINKKSMPIQVSLTKKNSDYFISGNFFDASSQIKNFIKNQNQTSKIKLFSNLNSKINIKFEKILIDKDSYFNNFDGNIRFKKNNIYFSDINSLINNKHKFKFNLLTDKNNQKITNLFIENPESFIKNYDFIKGFKEGKLVYESVKINNKSRSKLNIYNFKIREVPILAKLLTLASLQGIADLLTGEGIRFDEFEMDYITTKNKTEIKEMFALGPAISILMEGYIVKNEVTSLRGTLVPATTINKSISKIPLLGDILVGKKVGEGVFGVSFKIKGAPKKLKTTVNPIKTLTPRFITRTLEKISN